jgi:hypothetical protein
MYWRWWVFVSLYGSFLKEWIIVCDEADGKTNDNKKTKI